MENEWLKRDNKNLQAQNRMLRQAVLRLEAQLAQARLEASIEKTRELTDTAWLQGKVLRQKRYIKALEAAAALRREETREHVAETPCGKANPKYADMFCTKPRDGHKKHGYAGIFWEDSDERLDSD